jgi:hypothetical protein
MAVIKRNAKVYNFLLPLVLADKYWNDNEQAVVLKNGNGCSYTHAERPIAVRRIRFIVYFMYDDDKYCREQ